MKFSYSQELNADIDTVLGMFCNPDYHPRLHEALGAIGLKQVDHSDDGNDFMIKLAYAVKSDAPLPAFAKKVLGDTTNVVQTERWSRDSQTGHVNLDMKGLPGTLQCETSLEDNGDTCIKHFEWEVKIKIPLVGGKIEKLIADDVCRKYPIEAKTANSLLPDFS